MDSQTQISELTAIHAEYESFFTKCELLVGSNAAKLRPLSVSSQGSANMYDKLLLTRRKNIIRILTNEDIPLDVTVELRGWTADESKYYETFEALMMDVSSSFRLKFGNDLTDRLNELIGL